MKAFAYVVVNAIKFADANAVKNNFSSNGIHKQNNVFGVPRLRQEYVAEILQTRDNGNV
jgi:hypothetical protein